LRPEAAVEQIADRRGSADAAGDSMVAISTPNRAAPLFFRAGGYV